MDRNSNKYTFIYASVMVILVAAILSIAAMTFKPFTEEEHRNREEAEYSGIGKYYDDRQRCGKSLCRRRS
jgi:hypothetical protein